MSTKMIACGNRAVHGKGWGVQHHHTSVAEVRECFATRGGVPSVEESEAAQEAWGEDPDAAYERHLENAGWRESAAQEDYEAAMGMVSYEEARDAALAAYRNADGSIVFPDGDGQPDLVVGPKVEVLEKPEQPTLAIEAKVDFQGLPDGVYTVEIEGGHRTFQVKTQKTDAKFAPGKRIVSVLSGKDNEHDYTGIGFVSTDGHGTHRLSLWKKANVTPETLAAVQVLLADPRSALEAGRCYRCSRLLTTPESLSAGVGPECARKVGM